MKKNTWKKIAAGTMAMALVAGMAPANVGGFLTRSTEIVAKAYTPERSVIESWLNTTETYSPSADLTNIKISTSAASCINESSGVTADLLVFEGGAATSIPKGTTTSALTSAYVNYGMNTETTYYIVTVAEYQNKLIELAFASDSADDFTWKTADAGYTASIHDTLTNSDYTVETITTEQVYKLAQAVKNDEAGTYFKTPSWETNADGCTLSFEIKESLKLTLLTTPAALSELNIGLSDEAVKVLAKSGFKVTATAVRDDDNYKTDYSVTFPGGNEQEPVVFEGPAAMDNLDGEDVIAKTPDVFKRAVQDGAKSITLGNDIDLSDDEYFNFGVTRDLTLDLAGHELNVGKKVEDGTYVRGIHVDPGYNLTINDTHTGEQKGSIVNLDDLSADADSENNSAASIIINGGVFTLASASPFTGNVTLKGGAYNFTSDVLTALINTDYYKLVTADDGYTSVVAKTTHKAGTPTASLDSTGNLVVTVPCVQTDCDECGSDGDGVFKEYKVSSEQLSTVFTALKTAQIAPTFTWASNNTATAEFSLTDAQVTALASALTEQSIDTDEAAAIAATLSTVTFPTETSPKSYNATCEADAYTVYTAQLGNFTDDKTVTSPNTKIDHDWTVSGTPVDKDGDLVFTLTCTRADDDADHETDTAILNTSMQAEILKYPKDYGAVLNWDWYDDSLTVEFDEDNDDAYNAFVETFGLAPSVFDYLCKNGLHYDVVSERNDEKSKEATCTEDGLFAQTMSVTVGGETFTSEYLDPIRAQGHDYRFSDPEIDGKGNLAFGVSCAKGDLPETTLYVPADMWAQLLADADEYGVGFAWNWADKTVTVNITDDAFYELSSCFVDADGEHVTLDFAWGMVSDDGYNVVLPINVEEKDGMYYGTLTVEGQVIATESEKIEREADPVEDEPEDTTPAAPTEEELAAAKNKLIANVLAFAQKNDLKPTIDIAAKTITVQIPSDKASELLNVGMINEEMAAALTDGVTVPVDVTPNADGTYAVTVTINGEPVYSTTYGTPVEEETPVDTDKEETPADTDKEDTTADTDKEETPADTDMEETPTEAPDEKIPDEKGVAEEFQLPENAQEIKPEKADENGNQTASLESAKPDSASTISYDEMTITLDEGTMKLLEQICGGSLAGVTVDVSTKIMSDQLNEKQATIFEMAQKNNSLLKAFDFTIKQNGKATNLNTKGDGKMFIDIPLDNVAAAMKLMSVYLDENGNLLEMKFTLYVKDGETYARIFTTHNSVYMLIDAESELAKSVVTLAQQEAAEDTASSASETETPAEEATEAPAEEATEAPAEEATEAPTEAATEAPTEAATEAPTTAPTANDSTGKSRIDRVIDKVLPRTGNNNPFKAGAVAAALGLTSLGSFALWKSGIFRKKKDDE